MNRSFASAGLGAIVGISVAMMLGQTSPTGKATPGPMIWTVRNQLEQPGPTGVGNLVTFDARELVSVRPGGGAHAGKTYLIRRSPTNGTLVVNGDFAWWRQMWQLDTGAGHRDLSAR